MIPYLTSFCPCQSLSDWNYGTYYISCCILVSRSLTNHKLSGPISADLGKLDQLKFLYVIKGLSCCFGSWYFFAVFKVYCCYWCFASYLLVEIFIATTFMGKFLRNWETAQSCRDCKFLGLSVCPFNDQMIIYCTKVLWTKWWLIIFVFSSIRFWPKAVEEKCPCSSCLDPSVVVTYYMVNRRC